MAKIDLSPRKLKESGIQVDRLILGTMTFGSQVEEAEAARMVAYARDHGIGTFDTANGYNGGTSEEILGRVVKPFRNSVQLSTKIGLSKTITAPLSRERMTSAVHASLKRLQTDYIDVLYLHVPDPLTSFEETLGCADALIREGSVREIAQSNHAAWQISEMHRIATEHGFSKPWISQQMYNPIARRLEEEYAACAKYLDLITIAYNPLAGGLLTGKHRLDSEPSSGRFTQKHYFARYWNEQQFSAVNELQSLADERGLSIIALTFRWLLSRPLISSIVLGASNLDQLVHNVAVADGESLDVVDLQKIDEIWRPLRGIAPAYNR